jgi:hypothetical protein
MTVRIDDEADTVIVAVPFDCVHDLERQGLAFAVPVFRGAVLDAVVTVGVDSATLVTLLQAPDSIRAFATWIRDRCAWSGDSIELSAKRRGQRLRLKVDGKVDAGVVADFLAAAFADHESEP